LLVFSSSYLIANISSLTIAFFPIFSCQLFVSKVFFSYISFLGTACINFQCSSCCNRFPFSLIKKIPLDRALSVWVDS
jgi:hypothetical protein